MSQTARELGISGKTLHTWKQKFGTRHLVSAEMSTPAELAVRVAQLERQLSVREEQISFRARFYPRLSIDEVSI